MESLEALKVYCFVPLWCFFVAVLNLGGVGKAKDDELDKISLIIGLVFLGVGCVWLIVNITMWVIS